ncbi:MAG: hypothetical protein ACLGQX_08615 [Acidobacteriota bacterium]
MWPLGNDAHNAVLLSLVGDVIAFLALLASIPAIMISRRVSRRTTEPVLTLRIPDPLFNFHAELMNTGAVPATSIQIELIEKKKRASALLYVNAFLGTDDPPCPIRALNFPCELIDQLRNNTVDPVTIGFMVNRIRTGDQNPVSSARDPIEIERWERQIALHLLTRQGGQRIIISCAVPDGHRQQRVYKVSNRSGLQMCKLPVRIHAWYLRHRYKKNAELMPMPEMPAL